MYNMINKRQEMRDNPSFAKAIIYDVISGSKMGAEILYNFKIGNSLLKGSSEFIKSKDYFNIGDSCLIIYDKFNINIHEIYRDSNGYMIIYPKIGNVSD